MVRLAQEVSVEPQEREEIQDPMACLGLRAVQEPLALMDRRVIRGQLGHSESQVHLGFRECPENEGSLDLLDLKENMVRWVPEERRELLVMMEPGAFLDQLDPLDQLDQPEKREKWDPEGLLEHRVPEPQLVLLVSLVLLVLLVFLDLLVRMVSLV